MSDRERVIFKRLRLEAKDGAGHTVMNFSSSEYDDVVQLRDKIVATNTSGTLTVRLIEEAFTERELSAETYGSCEVEDIGL